MDMNEEYKLLKTVYDVIRLRCNVSKMSFITRSLALINYPATFRKDNDE